MNSIPKAGSAVLPISLSLSASSTSSAVTDASTSFAHIGLSASVAFSVSHVRQLTALSPRVSEQGICGLKTSSQSRNVISVRSELPRMGRQSFEIVARNYLLQDGKTNSDMRLSLPADLSFSPCNSSAKTDGLNALPLSVLSLICAYLPSKNPVFTLTSYHSNIPSLSEVRDFLSAAGYDASQISNALLARQMLPFDKRYFQIIPLAERSLEICQKAVLAGFGLAYVPSHIHKDSALCLMAIKNNPEEWCRIPQSIKDNSTFVFSAVMENGLVLRRMVESFFPSLDLCCAAVTQNNLAIDFVPPIYLHRHEDLLRIAAHQYHIQIGDSSAPNNRNLNTSQVRDQLISKHQRAQILSMQADIFSVLDVSTESWPRDARLQDDEV